MLYQRNGEPVSENTLRSWMSARSEPAALRECHIHQLRHTFCSHLAMRGAAAKAIKSWLAMRTSRTTMRYMHLSAGVAQQRSVARAGAVRSGATVGQRRLKRSRN